MFLDTKAIDRYPTQNKSRTGPGHRYVSPRHRNYI